MLAAVRGHRLVELRREDGLSVEEAARRLQVSEDEVLDIERGLLDYVRISTLRAYVNSLGGELEVTARFGDVSVTLA